MKNNYKTSVLTLIMLAMVTSSNADTFGPYRFKTGVAQSHARWELKLQLNETNLILNNCVQMVTNFVPEYQEMRCWDEEIEDFAVSSSLLYFRDGYETYSLELKSNRLIVKDGKITFADVLPGKPDWDTIGIHAAE